MVLVVVVLVVVVLVVVVLVVVVLVAVPTPAQVRVDPKFQLTKKKLYRSSCSTF